MRDLLDFILKGVLGEDLPADATHQALQAGKFEIIESEQDGRIMFSIKTDPKNIGLIIGKGGHMIKSLRNILKVRATLEKKAVSLDISEPQA